MSVPSVYSSQYRNLMAAGDPQSRHTLAVNSEQEFLHRTAVKEMPLEGEAEIFATGISTS